MTTVAPVSSTLSTASTLAPSAPTFQFPPHYSFPPFFTLQPTASTRLSQLATWSAFIQSYCRHHRIFSLSLVDALSTPLFTNAPLSRRLSLRDATAIINYMASPEGGNRAEFVNSDRGSKKRAVNEEGGKAWIYWRKPEEWSAALEEWVEQTGQRGSVLTLYEIVEGDASRKEEFWGMDVELLQKSLAGCVKRGKAQIFGNEGSEGVKFF